IVDQLLLVRERNICCVHQRVDVSRRVCQCIIAVAKLRSSHELTNECHLVRFQLSICQKAADLRKVRRKFFVERSPTEAHGVEAIDEVATRLKLRTSEESSTDFNAVAGRWIFSPTVIQNIKPTR